MARLAERDAELKAAAGSDYDNDAIKLVRLYEGMSRSTVYAHLQSVRMGDPQNRRAVAPNFTSRLVESTSILYRAPASRRLRDASGSYLADDEPAARALADAVELLDLDSAFQVADAYRQLLRTCFVKFAAVPSRPAPVVRIFAPYNVRRKPSPGALDLIDEDEAIAFCLRLGDEKPDTQIWESWVHLDDGSWQYALTDGAGALRSAPTVSPAGDLVPAIIFADAPLLGRAYLPIPEGRLDLVLATTALAADLAYLTKLEAHTIKIHYTNRPLGAPDKIGPDQLVLAPVEDRYEALGQSPQFSGVTSAIDTFLSALALSEGMPPDAFSPARTLPASSLTLKVALADLEARRQKQLGPTRAAEREAYRKYARVWNASGAEGELDESLRLAVSFARTWSPVDRREHQEVAFKDIAAGYMSPIDYRAEAYGETRDQAIAAIERAREDLERYPWAQNPAAMTDGPHAPGVDATPVRGAPRPDVSAAVEGASTLAAVLTAQDAS